MTIASFCHILQNSKTLWCSSHFLPLLLHEITSNSPCVFFFFPKLAQCPHTNCSHYFQSQLHHCSEGFLHVSSWLRRWRTPLRTKRVMKATDLDLLHAVNLGLHSSGIYLICEHGQSEGTMNTNRIGSNKNKIILKNFWRLEKKSTECKFKLLDWPEVTPSEFGMIRNMKVNK